MSTVARLSQTLSAHSSDVNSVSFSNNSLATASSDKTVRLWSVDDFSELPCSPLCGHTYQVYCCAFSPFGNMLASGSMDGKIILWNSKTGEKIATFEHKSKNCIRSCRFSPDSSTLVSGCDDNSLCLWDISSKKLIRSLEGHEESVVACAFSPDSAYVASGSTEGDLMVWDGKYGHGKALTFYMDAHDLGVTGCDFSPTYGSAVNNPMSIHFLLATCGNDNLVKLWDIITYPGSPKIVLRLRDTLAGHSCQVMTCCFGPSGKILASGSGDKSVRLWDTYKAEPLHTIEGHSRFVTCCAFSAGEKYLATGSGDRSVMIWEITTEQQLTGSATYQDVIDSLPADPVIVNYKALSHWTTADVCAWLAELDLAQYEDVFKQNHIDGAELTHLTNETLQTSLKIDALGHRNKILRAIEKVSKNPVKSLRQTSLNENNIPDEYLCPISREIMQDPVLAADGYTYEQVEISAWINSGKTRSPMTNVPLTSMGLVPNRNLKMLIQRYQQKSN